MNRVLIVDDERFVRMGIASNTDWKSVDCELVGEAVNGQDGFAKALKLHPDLIITDIRMPEMDGIEMVRRIREEQMDIKVIFLTAYEEFSYAQQAIRLKASDYILKPFDDGELEGAISRLLYDRSRASYVRQEEDAVPLREKTPEMHRYVQNAIDFITDHYPEESLSVSSIAAAVSVSEGHLSRLFKQETGMSINTYITHYRMRVAVRLLQDVHYKVYEVAEKVGYKDIGYFSSTFRKILGVLPSDYQNGIRNHEKTEKQ